MPLIQELLALPEGLHRSALLQENTFFPAAMYTDPRLLPLEFQMLQGSWQYVGDSANLAPGEVLVADVAGLSVLITRDRSGSLQAFHNVCPHRAARLYPESGIYCAQHLICPYHGWVYDFKGELIGTPAKRRFPEGFCQAAFPLQPVRLESWDGFLFVCFDAEAPSLPDFLHPIPDLAKGYRTAATQRILQQQYHIGCNWKNLHDNSMCDYHVAIAHRHTLHSLQGPVGLYEYEFWEYVNLLYTPTTADWRSANPVLEHLPERNRLGFFTYGIFPNQQLLALPDGLLIWVRIDPVTVDRCQLTLDVYGIPGVTAPSEEIDRSFRETIEEDIVITEGVQQGYASGAYQPGIANELEARVLHQQKLMRRFLLNALEPAMN